MQTFVPYGTDHWATARCLDDKRLGKQRVEGYQILRALLNETKGWKNHPAVKMWHGYEPGLVVYTLTMCAAWKERGYQDTVSDKVAALAGKWFNGEICTYDPVDHTWCWPEGNISEVSFIFGPSWLDEKNVLQSHQSNLVHKYPQHYGSMWPHWLEQPKLDYVWPQPYLFPRSNIVVFDHLSPHRSPYGELSWTVTT